MKLWSRTGFDDKRFCERFGFAHVWFTDWSLFWNVPPSSPPAELSHQQDAEVHEHVICSNSGKLFSSKLQMEIRKRRVSQVARKSAAAETFRGVRLGRGQAERCTEISKLHGILKP